jgi:mannan endo-1,4-beta-mannosidase
MKTIQSILRVLLVVTVLAACGKQRGDNPIPGTNKAGLHVVNNSYLADGAGNKLVLRGVNMGSAYADGFGMTEIPEIEKTGANAVRLVLQQQYDNSTKGVTTPAQIESLISSCINNGMIPVLELHDFTGTADVSNSLNQAVLWWTGNEMKSMLLKYQQSIIINIANEPDDGSADAGTYSNANIDAVKKMRTAGITCPLMIDAPGWGKDHNYFVQSGKALIDADPLHNLIFSVHTYWPAIGAYGNYSDQQITENLNNLSNTGLPMVVGELASVDDQDNNGLKAINYKLIMQLCQQNQMGYMVWWWGFSKPEGSNNAESMTPSGTYDGLTGTGKVFAVSDVNSIKNTSRRASGLK